MINYDPRPIYAAAIVEGTDVFAVSMTDRVHDARIYRETVVAACALWSDDELLTAQLTAPWGVVPGAGALWGFVNETLVHGWDLAVATGRDAEAPFGAVVPSRADAGPTEILANWSGRQSAEWVTRARS